MKRSFSIACGRAATENSAMRFRALHAWYLVPIALVLGGCAELADHGVAVSSSAFSDYSEAKYNGAAPKRETYVFMQGNYFSGVIVDGSLQQTPFRRVAEMLAPELAKRAFWPAADTKSADLVLVVHWGVTSPSEKLDKLLAQDPPSLARIAGVDANTGVDYHAQITDATNPSRGEPLVSDQMVNDTFVGIASADIMSVGFQQAVERTDQLGADYNRADAMKLLGYRRHLQKMAEHPFLTAEEATLRSDLESERYFVVIQAYDLRQVRGRKPKLVWTLHLNMRSAGNNFQEAVAMMGDVAVNYFGRNVDQVDTALPKVRQGQVTIGEITIVGESR